MTEELIQAVSASAGGMASTLLLFPLDVIKTKMQASRRTSVEEQADKADCASSGNVNNNSIASTSTNGSLSGSSSAMAVACELAAGGSIKPFFSGVGPGLVQSGIEKGIYFYAYTFLKAFWASRIGSLSTASTLLLGYAADFTHLPVSLALDTVVKTMQTAKPETPGAPRPGPAQVAAHLYKAKGVAGFYKGLAAYVVLCLRPAIQFAVFERFKAWKLAARQNSPATNAGLSALEAFVLGALARAVATVAVYPYTRAKVMAQVSAQARDTETASTTPGAAAAAAADSAAATATVTAGEATAAEGASNGGGGGGGSATSTPSSPAQPPLAQPAPQTLLSAMHAIFAEDGVAGLFHGLGPEVFRGMLSGAVMLMVKEKIENATRLALQGNGKSIAVSNALVRATA